MKTLSIEFSFKNIKAAKVFCYDFRPIVILFEDHIEIAKTCVCSPAEPI